MGREWWTGQELAGLPGMPGTSRGINKQGDRGVYARRHRQHGKGWEYHISSLPPETQAALTLADASQATQERRPNRTSDIRRSALWAHFDQAPNRKKAKAERRLSALQTAHRLAEQLGRKSAAFEAVASAHGISTATLYQWQQQVDGLEKSDWLPALLPGHTGRTARAACSPEAWDYFTADYLRLEQPAASACYERLQRIAAERGWKVPSCKTLMRRIEREIPRPAIILARQGREALSRAYPPQERDHSVYHALEAVNADGHRFDTFVRWPDGEICRPMMIAWQDIYSGKLLSWRIEKTESSCGYRLSFGDMVSHFGIPDHVFLDNGRGIASKYLTGGAPTRYRFKVRNEDPVGLITNLVGTEGVHWTTPYHGQAKPIERAFRDLCEYVAKHPALSGAYTGNHPMAKPENYGSRAVELDVFLGILEQEIHAHNARQGRRSKVCAGKSFDQVFSASYAQAPIRKATDAQRRLWLLAADGVRAHREDGSVRINGNRYWSEALAQHAGKKLTVRFDPDALHGSIHCYQLDGRYIGAADCVQAAGFGDIDAAREHARLRKANAREARKALERERRMSALEAARQLPETEAPEAMETKVVRLARPKRAAGSDVAAPDPNDEAFVRAVSDLKKGWDPI